MVLKSHHWLHQFQLVTEHSFKGATNYSNRATGVGTKQVYALLSLPLQVSCSILYTMLVIKFSIVFNHYNSKLFSAAINWKQAGRQQFILSKMPQETKQKK